MLQMTPRQIREEIEAIDKDLAELEPWEKNLNKMRKRYVLSQERDVIDIIENGLRAGQGRPAYSDLEPFDDGWPGLHEARETIAELKERRALLVEQQPTKAQTDSRIREAEALAINVRKRAKALYATRDAAHAALNDAARLCLAVADETWLLAEANAELDKLTSDADITRPETPRPGAPTFPLAASASVLLGAFFRGGPAVRIDENVVPDIRAALIKQEAEAIET